MKLIKLILILSLFFHQNTLADINIEFEKWKKNFKKQRKIVNMGYFLKAL